MGCLNSGHGFEHWFANIHLSGPCNRSCYFCIGQFMMGLDPYNTLDTFPLPNLEVFLDECVEKEVKDINLTGTNTDPLLYKHTGELVEYIRKKVPNASVKIRTNAVKKNLSDLQYYDAGSVTICSFDPEIYKKMMGRGEPPKLSRIMENTEDWDDLKVNIVLGPENVGDDLAKTLNILSNYNIPRVNLREPYGQPHVGDPLHSKYDHLEIGKVLGNPTYCWTDDMVVTYWDVHYTHVESINLYANGNISRDYPITRGHDEKEGEVKDQSQFTHGRKRKQWVSEQKRPKV